jgi:mannose-6-phosphate isomerase-like protein (cupin superfamily)
MTTARLSRRALVLAAFAAGAAHAAGVADVADAGDAVPLDERARRLLAALHDPLLDGALRAWPAPGLRRTVTATSVPVLRHLPAARELAPAFSAGFVGALTAAAPGLAWRRSYSESQVGAAFLADYGWTELVGLTGPVSATTLACGVLVLGPGTTYPLHHHEADEIYVPLSGVADWRHGSEAFTPRQPGEVIHHASGVSHAMRTGASPLVALYLWQSRDLAQKSQLDDPGAPH